jgi:hypothetical protein
VRVAMVLTSFGRIKRLSFGFAKPTFSSWG